MVYIKVVIHFFKTDLKTGRRTTQIDNELIVYVEMYLAGKTTPGELRVNVDKVFNNKNIVPMYYDKRYIDPIKSTLRKHKVKGITLVSLIKLGILSVRGGHGSPSNDQRTGTIPYIKVSDIRALRININPTNLVSDSVARNFWRGDDSGIHAWDLITPNRASSNIGEFAIVLPGEERLVITKEVFIFRVENSKLYNPFYLLWALSLLSVREQWRRIALMQTNREDCGERFREIIIPEPLSKKWVSKVSKSFYDYFTTLDATQNNFRNALKSDDFEYVASVAPE